MRIQFVRWFFATLSIACGGLAAAPAAAATFTCEALTAVINDFNGGTVSQGTPCFSLIGPTPTYTGTATLLSQAGASAGSLSSSSTAQTSDRNGAFASSAQSTSDFRDTAVVSGLGAAGATLNFAVRILSQATATASPPTLFTAATAAGDFDARATISTSGGLSSSAQVNGCVRSTTTGVSVCNAQFNYGPSSSVQGSDTVLLSVFVMNGDTLDINLHAHTSGFVLLQANSDSGRLDSYLQVRWNGLIPNGESQNLVLTSTSGFDFTRSVDAPEAGVPEPSVWALMFMGIGALRSAQRRRRPATDLNSRADGTKSSPPN